jgi:O-antigen/teichoic acid export membrane protein
MTMDTELEPSAAEEFSLARVRGLESSALRGTYWVVIFYGLSMVLRLGSSIVLSRLFLPQYFGLMTLITTVIIGINLFSHVGVQESIIQDPRGDVPVFLQTAWTLQVIRGLGLFLLTIPLAWPVAHFYHQPQIIVLLPWLGFTCLLAGFSSPSLLVLSRHLGVGRLSAMELLTQFVQFAVTWVWALFHPSIWALMAGRVISEVCGTGISYLLLPEVRARFTWDKESIHALVKFGRWILIGTALTFLALQSDRLILAKLISLQMLGVYGIAFALSDIPRQIILMFCSRVGFPFIAKFSDQPRPAFRQILLKYRLPVLAVGGLMLIAVICTGDLFILRVYTKPYHDAAWMIPILAVGLWHTLLYSTISPAILSLQKPHYNAFAYLVYCITLFIFLPWGFHALGMVGAVIAIAFSDLPVYFVNAYSASREGLPTLNQDALLTLSFLGLLAVALWARHWLGFGFPFPHQFLR